MGTGPSLRCESSWCVPRTDEWKLRNRAADAKLHVTCRLLKAPALGSLGYHDVAREKYMKAQIEEIPDCVYLTLCIHSKGRLTLSLRSHT